MKLEIYKRNEIKDVDSWFKYAEPKGGKKQWKDGCSANEFARYMTHCGGKLPKEIENYLKSIGIKDKECFCQPEYITSYSGYDLGVGGGRNHDALLTTADAVIGVEAKVSESFEKSVEVKLNEAKKNSDKGKNTNKRVVESIKLITGKDYSDSKSEVKHLMYQLISATTGTLIEAHKANVQKAVVLVIEFDGDVEKKRGKDKESNKKAFDDFLGFLNIKGKDDKNRKISVTVKDNKIEVWFKMLTISITKSDVKYTYKC